MQTTPIHGGFPDSAPSPRICDAKQAHQGDMKAEGGGEQSSPPGKLPILRATSEDGYAVDVRASEWAPTIFVEVGADLVAIPADIAGRVAKHLEHAAALVANRYRVAA